MGCGMMTRDKRDENGLQNGYGILFRKLHTRMFKMTNKLTSFVGDALGLADGDLEGDAEGSLIGLFEGDELGLYVGCVMDDTEIETRKMHVCVFLR